MSGKIFDIEGITKDFTAIFSGKPVSNGAKFVKERPVSAAVAFIALPFEVATGGFISMSTAAGLTAYGAAKHSQGSQQEKENPYIPKQRQFKKD